ncbi:TetR/AcrR family transcriptional regulator [Heyndrickxia coagulans]|uniref:TetR/AcrR family transcriptional regulator n=1 Tax=Heyndrickxia coagulans TaxID=1398 RepID=UPI002E229C3F|nr:TetR/AcrR family transcriptional regulator [Heyndrickxia coagulans]MED4406616.1 TetR/AcrR family transcriptional regulator [Heyndrickxia coagulans]
MSQKKFVPASVRDERLIEKRRNQMINAAVALFKEKGFHRTTTREIAKKSGFSIGTLYEYIRAKEDVLYLVCDRIYDEVRDRLLRIDAGQGTLESLKLAIAHYFRIVDELQDEVLVMYQEAKSLTKEALPYVLKKEMEMVGIFEKMIKKCAENGELDLEEKEIEMLAHNIFVQGEMWAFRRWAFKKKFTIEDYIRLQTHLLFSGLETRGMMA